MQNTTLFFTKRARTLKKIFIFLMVLFCISELFLLGVVVWGFTPLASADDIKITFNTDGYGNRIATKFEIEPHSPYIQLSSDLMLPTNEFKLPTQKAVSVISLFGALMKLPMLLGIWWSIEIFTKLEKSETPFTSALFEKITNLGKLTILYGLLSNLIYSILIAIFVTGELRAMNPVNLYVVIIGLVLYIVSEILEYGVGLQTEVDGLL